ncbi:hypothetical protein [Chitinophaga solisilvae]|uniref:hypothetical protein n=1 Tax=Chitinophaga solisilvae TaxID=1233460 RepID=UPI00136E63B6|nr:hypothetical protein [Chitinophaga solisilvae]
MENTPQKPPVQTGHSWPDLIIKHFPIVRVLIIVLLITGLIAGIYVYTTNGKVSLMGFSFEKSHTQVKDSLLKKQTDTVYINNTPPAPKAAPAKEKPVVPVQKNQSGKNEANVNTGTNNGIIGGENNKADNSNHIVQGNNNGINGDVTVIAEKTFASGEENELLKLIDKLEKENNIAFSCFNIYVLNTSNGQKVAQQMTDFLVSKGYTLQRSGIRFAAGGKGGKGINVIYDNQSGCLDITVGTL